MNELGYKKSVAVLVRWAEVYYRDNDPVATDDEYDNLNLRLKVYEKENHIRRPNCDNCTHSYTCGARLACGLTKMVTVNEHWCIEHGQRRQENE
ncbi:hypothetical protein J7J63_03880 [Candidatus Bipolaricaulota bacterium]|nr:hypothetical protein [Candidatus Bipolaricaulota bacterium]